MKNLILTVSFVLLWSICGTAQNNFEVPKNLQLNVDADFAKYKDDVINAAKWLEETDLTKETVKRKEINAFIIKWTTGVPDFTIDVTDGLKKLYGKNNELIIVFFASYSRNYLENKDATNQTATKAGLISMMNVYKKGIAIIKNNDMDNAIKANENNKLDEYINTNIISE